MLIDCDFEKIRNKIKIEDENLKNSYFLIDPNDAFLFDIGDKNVKLDDIIKALDKKSVILSDDNEKNIKNCSSILKMINKELEEKEYRTNEKYKAKAEYNRIYLINKTINELKENKVNFIIDNLQVLIIHPIICSNGINDFLSFLNKKEYLYKVIAGRIRVYKNTSLNIKNEIEEYINKNSENSEVLVEELFYSKEISWDDILDYCKIMSNTIFVN